MRRVPRSFIVCGLLKKSTMIAPSIPKQAPEAPATACGRQQQGGLTSSVGDHHLRLHEERVQ